MILLIDNYDSFSYNLYQYIGQIKPDIKVVRNDELTVSEVEKLAPSHIVLSPGPGRPDEAGICEQLVKELKGKFPILGVCLGHQAICEAFGAKIVSAPTLMHGKTSMADIDTDSVLFNGFEKKLRVGRYHSLCALESSLPSELKVTAKAEDGEVMAVEHESLPVYGLQFHPESILTENGIRIIRNFLP